MKIKQKKIEEEGDADDQCSADILLRGVSPFDMLNWSGYMIFFSFKGLNHYI